MTLPPGGGSVGVVEPPVVRTATEALTGPVWSAVSRACTA
ncbi:hypothetical protein M2169_001913 [Streptomyces sp. MJP52]|nr:hypothetical protein [Streptomyces sp. MJP52]